MADEQDGKQSEQRGKETQQPDPPDPHTGADSKAGAKPQAPEADDAANPDERIKALESKVAQYETRQQRSQWREQVSDATGIPAKLLHGSTLKEMQDCAESIDEYVQSKTKNTGVRNQGRTPKTPPAGQQSRDWVDKLFGNIR